jgi:hypothetical protein
MGPVGEVFLRSIILKTSQHNVATAGPRTLEFRRVEPGKLVVSHGEQAPVPSPQPLFNNHSLVA